MHAKRTAYEYVVAKNTLKAKFVRADALGGEGPAANGTRVLHDVHGIQVTQPPCVVCIFNIFVFFCIFLPRLR